MSKVLGYALVVGAAGLGFLAMTASQATAIPEARIPSVSWLEEPQGKAASPPGARAKAAQPDGKAVPSKAQPHSERAPADPDEAEGVGMLSVTSAPTGGAVFLDGANVGQTPVEVDLPSGEHKVRVVHPSNGTDRRQSVIVKAHDTTTVRVLF